jgi:hypothetical protein
MKALAWVVELMFSGALLADGFNRLLVPVPTAPTSVPWLAGMSEMAQWILYAVGGMEVFGGFALLFPALLSMTDWADTWHVPHHGVRL